jgi:hypothetical protein
MEEKLLEIIKTDKIFLKGHAEQCAKNIADVFSEFINWTGFMSSRLIYREIDDDWLLVQDLDKIDDWTSYTLDELFNYWWDNVKEKS